MPQANPIQASMLQLAKPLRAQTLMRVERQFPSNLNVPKL